MTSDSASFMVVFLILILIFALFMTYLILNAKKSTESYTNYNPYKPFRGRAPNAPPGCCGNLDWCIIRVKKGLRLMCKHAGILGCISV